MQPDKNQKLLPNSTLVKNFVSALTFGIVFTGVFHLVSCKKINDATFLGNDLIPAVDNVTTFDTTVNVEAYNGLFTLGGTDPLTEDSTLIGRGAEHFVGYIGNDPLFGKTKCSLYLELKPQIFPNTFDFKKIDSLKAFDSVVLILGYTRTFGDTNTAISLNVKEMSQTSDFRFDTNYLIRTNTFTYGQTLSSNSISNGTAVVSAIILPSTLNDSVHAFKDSANINQVRIRLLNSFGMRLLQFDSATYATDSAFRTHFKGFAIIPDQVGNAVIGVDLLSANTKLALYYHYKNGPVTDTTVVTYFPFTGTCAHANLVERDYAGTPLLASQGGTAPDNFVYLQNTPGSFATIKMPNLQLVSNRTVHRAELIMEQVYDPSSDNIFSVPDDLFLDAYDTVQKKYRTIPYDLSFDASGNLNKETFGMVGKKADDGSGNIVTVWKFNITRYVQNYLTRRDSLYNLRVFAPFQVDDLYRIASSTGSTDINQVFNPNPLIVAGRVRLAGGTPINNPHRMRLRIIYSKL